MAGANEGKMLATGGEGRTNLANTPGIDSSVQPKPLMSSKIVQKYPKKWMLKALPASGTTGSGEVTKEKRRRVKPLRKPGEKVSEGRPAMVDDLNVVEERAGWQLFIEMMIRTRWLLALLRGFDLALRRKNPS
ncbi:hypothetical protein GIB67_028922 [Kingdonia uniflora]|uniref:Uncharacterized protein n=1 Tax=Kingdonia uniflora TaxID=39325 RepID=A0A7J7LBR9_9MAGN|nr:hypothetical protein GIB67_028922 [Kingdonia uniflora]